MRRNEEHIIVLAKSNNI